MKIFCIGRNYADHARELNNPVPAEPVIFMKPPTALLQGNKPFYYPSFTRDLHYEVEIVLRICKNGRSVELPFANRYYDRIALGIDFTARDLQEQCKAKGLPWEKAKAFDHSAVLGAFRPLAETDLTDLRFSLYKNGIAVQQGTTADMLFSPDQIIVHLSRYFTLQQGDLVYTGTPAGVGAVAIGDVLEGYIGQEQQFTCAVK